MRPTDSQTNRRAIFTLRQPTKCGMSLFGHFCSFAPTASDEGGGRGRRALQRGKVRELHNGGGGGGRMQLTVVGSLLVRPFPFDDAMPHIFSLSLS